MKGRPRSRASSRAGGFGGVVVRAAQDQLRARLGAQRVDLGLGRRFGHDHDRLRPEQCGRAGDAQSVVAGARRDDTLLALIVG